MALAQKGHEISQPSDLVKDPLVLEFAGLRQDERLREFDLEHALISKLQQFLLELGKGFAFMGRQQRITLDGEHFFIDLVFYNRLTRSFVLVDLKVGKLTHQDLGQMQMYVNYYQRELTAQHGSGNRDAARKAQDGQVYHALNRSVGRIHLLRKDADFEAFQHDVIEALRCDPSRILSS